MKRHMQAALTALTLGLLAAPAGAQVGGYIRPQTSPIYRPPVSPYLNILRGPGGYFNVTRPQQDAFRALGQLQSGLQGLQSQVDASSSLGGLPLAQGTTGHPVAFFNYGGYYTFPFPRYGPNVGNFGVGGAGTGAATGTGMANQPGAPPGGQQRKSITPIIGVGR